MTDTQLLTLAMSLVIPVSLLIYSNSRITEAKDTLRAEIAAGFARMSSEIKSLEAKLTLHEVEHHHER